MRDTLTLTVHCLALGPCSQTAFVITRGLSATFTLGEVLIILGPQAVIDLYLKGQATIEASKPLAWPLSLKRPSSDNADLLLPLTQLPPDITATGISA